MTRQPEDIDEALLREIADEVADDAAAGAMSGEDPIGTDAGPDTFALAVCDLDGNESATGDVAGRFPLQSIAKLFALTLALSKVGEDLWERVGREPSGDPYNSLVQLEHEKGRPRNPMINAGSLVVADVLLEHCDDPAAELRELLGDLAGEQLEVDEEVARLEGRRGHRNYAMGYLMSAFRRVHAPVEDIMRVYADQCAVLMTTPQLARAVRFLAAGGVDPASGRRVLSEPLVRRVNAVMLTCGTYDSAGQFAYEVGFPCKSGVAGAIVGAVPGRLGACVWSPPLDETGNSLAGREALHLLSERAGLSVFRA